MKDSPEISTINLSGRGVKIAHLNIRSLLKNSDVLKIIMSTKPFDVLTLAETWLNFNVDMSSPQRNANRKNKQNLMRFKLFLHPIVHLLLFLSPDWLTFGHAIISPI